MKNNILNRTITAAALSAILISLSACTLREHGAKDFTNRPPETTPALTEAVPEETTAVPETTTTVPETTAPQSEPDDNGTVIIDEEIFLPALIEYDEDDKKQQIDEAALNEIYAKKDFVSGRCNLTLNSSVHDDYSRPQNKFTAEQAKELQKIFCGIKLDKKFEGDIEKLSDKYTELESIHLYLDEKLNASVQFYFYTYIGEPVLNLCYMDENYNYRMGYYRCNYDPLMNKALEFLIKNSDAYLEEHPVKLYSVQSNNYYTSHPFGTGLLELTFYLEDLKQKPFTDFEVGLEREINGKWETVTPLGGSIDQDNTGWGEFDFKDVWFDLAWYPELSPGKYRVVKPIYFDKNGEAWKEHRYYSREEHQKYIEENCRTENLYYEFELSDDNKRFERIGESISLTYDVYPLGTDTLSVNSGSKAMYSHSTAIDIQYNNNGRWESVRTTPIEANINKGYGIGSTDVDLRDYNMSRPGEYRLRMSVCIIKDDFTEIMSERFETWYVNFRME